MFKIKFSDYEVYNEQTNEFIQIKNDTVLNLEHSLVSISKWEAKYKKPFISDVQKTREELIYYVKCMVLTQNVSDDIYNLLTDEHFMLINEYIGDNMTATTFFTANKSFNAQPVQQPKKQVITSELIYYWMISCEIPFECQKWHLNRLLTLIRICNIKNSSGNKMNKKDLLTSNKSLNAARRKK